MTPFASLLLGLGDENPFCRPFRQKSLPIPAPTSADQSESGESLQSFSISISHEDGFTTTLTEESR